MKVLILHPNFPAQFRERAFWLVRQGHDVTFLCQTHYGRKIDGVKRITLKGDLGHERLKAATRSAYDEAVHRSAQYRAALQQLKANDYTPDVVISHTGWGCGLALADLWPHAHRIGYVEWWFQSTSSLTTFNEGCRWPVFKRSNKKWSPGNGGRNALILQELENCDTVISPTHWQRAQLPRTIRRRCIVIPDGIEINYFRRTIPSPDISDIKYLTYGTRGMEVVRGFPEFILELPSVLAQYEDIVVQIAGEDEINYGGKQPLEGSWGKWAIKYLKEAGLDHRVQFLGRLSRHNYRDWLYRSWCHVYLTQPYVASWSLLESMACGALLVASDVEPVREFVTNYEGFLVDHRQPGWLHAKIEQIYLNQEVFISLRKRLAEKVLAYDISASNLLWQSCICH
ncbi:glycosyltransferase [Cyanobium sp. NS01]|uniref:glycosyltransferase n=1 Tax=Cyanobium sp. NS01 TaxID=261284 RepID=UPI00164578E0|nr:glycosyltransferase [Cyanobium sp. NS01]QNI69351.1 glycosyl transferase/ family 1 [Cyanobium sp. NS01]